MADGAGIVLLTSLFSIYGLSHGEQKPIREFGLDFYRPTKSDRQLDHYNIKIFLRQREYLKQSLRMKIGLSGSYSTGSITQLTGSLEEGTLKSTTFSSPGLGIGPVVETQVKLFERKSYALHFDFSGAVMYYDQDFPAGGRRYNGMFEIGPSLQKKNAAGNMSVGLRWMHISNGSGLTPRNPSYEGVALSIRFQH